jgi:hypothetical protein
MIRRTVIVEGPLALNMRRITAARDAEAGVQIMSLPQLAARLAGGFTRPAQSEDLDPAIQSAAPLRQKPFQMGEAAKSGRRSPVLEVCHVEAGTAAGSAARN